MRLDVLSCTLYNRHCREGTCYLKPFVIVYLYLLILFPVI